MAEQNQQQEEAGRTSAYPRGNPSTAASLANASRRTPLAELKVVAAESQADWIPATSRLPSVGEQVWCTDGMAEVSKLLGKTGDGSRLLELIVPSRPRHPFFAAASNVLVAPA